MVHSAQASRHNEADKVFTTKGDQCEFSTTGLHVLRRDERLRTQLAILCVICGYRAGGIDDFTLDSDTELE